MKKQTLTAIEMASPGRWKRAKKLVGAPGYLIVEYNSNDPREGTLATVKCRPCTGISLVQALKEAQGNAVLMAAAKDMYHALEEMVREFSHYQENAQGTSKCEAVIKASQLINSLKV